MKVSIEEYKTLNLKQLKKLARRLQELYGGNLPDKVNAVNDKDSAITEIVLFEAHLYETRNAERYSISDSLYLTFKQIKGYI
jgi:hypothetical protein